MSTIILFTLCSRALRSLSVWLILVVLLGLAGRGTASAAVGFGTAPHTVEYFTNAGRPHP